MTAKDLWPVTVACGVPDHSHRFILDVGLSGNGLLYPAEACAKALEVMCGPGRGILPPHCPFIEVTVFHAPHGGRRMAVSTMTAFYQGDHYADCAGRPIREADANMRLYRMNEI